MLLNGEEMNGLAFRTLWNVMRMSETWGREVQSSPVDRESTESESRWRERGEERLAGWATREARSQHHFGEKSRGASRCVAVHHSPHMSHIAIDLINQHQSLSASDLPLRHQFPPSALYTPPAHR